MVFAAAAGCRCSRERVEVEREEGVVVAGDRTAEVSAAAEVGRGGAGALGQVQEREQKSDTTLEQKACTG